MTANRTKPQKQPGNGTEFTLALTYPDIQTEFEEHLEFPLLVPGGKSPLRYWRDNFTNV